MECADITVSVRHARHDRNAATDSNVVPEARGEPQPGAAYRGRVSVLKEEPLVQPLYHPIVSKSDSPLEKETPPITRVVVERSGPHGHQIGRASCRERV